MENRSKVNPVDHNIINRSQTHLNFVTPIIDKIHRENRRKYDKKYGDKTSYQHQAFGKYHSGGTSYRHEEAEILNRRERHKVKIALSQGDYDTNRFHEKMPYLT